MTDAFTELNTGAGGSRMDETEVDYSPAPDPLRRRARIVVAGDDPADVAGVANAAVAHDAYGLAIRQVIDRREIGGLSFSETLGALATFTTPWVLIRNVNWLDIHAKLEATEAVSAVIEFTDAPDPNTVAPGVDDIVRGIATTLAGASLGGLNTPSFGIPAQMAWCRVQLTDVTGGQMIDVSTFGFDTPAAVAQVPLVTPLTDDFRVGLSKSVLAGKSPSGSYGNVGLTAQGDLRVGFDAVESSANSVATTVIGVGGEWVGAFEDARDFAGLHFNTTADGPVEGHVDFADDAAGLNVHTIDSGPFAGAAGFAVPVDGGKFVRVRATNIGGAPVTFTLQTLLKYGSTQPFVAPVIAQAQPSWPAALVRAVVSGQQPDGDYENERVSGTLPDFSTQTPLGVGGVFAPTFTPDPKQPAQLGPGYDATGFVSLTVVVFADQPSATGGLVVEFSNDGFVTIPESFSFTYRAADVGKGRRYLIPANVGEQVRVRYTNGAVAQTVFDLRSELSVVKTQPMSDDIGRGTLLVSPGLRISQVLGRTHQEVQIVGAAVSSTVFTVPAGRIFYATSVDLSIENASAASTARVRVRDGGALGAFKTGVAAEEATTGLGGINTVQEKTISYEEPLQFLTDVFLEVVTGIVVVDLKLVGYLEDAT